MSSPVNWSIQIAYATAAEWTSWNGVLKAGQEGHESDTGFRKIGDGTTEWNDLDYLFVNSTTSTDGITATPGGDQGSSIELTTLYNNVTVVASPDDGVKLLAAIKNVRQTVINGDATNDLDIYPQVGDAFYGQGVNAPFVLTAGSTLSVLCFTDGTWMLVN